MILWWNQYSVSLHGMALWMLSRKVQLIQCIMCNLESNISLRGVYYNNVTVYYAGLSIYLCKVALIWTVSVLPGFFNGTVSIFFRLFNRNKNTVLISKHIIACNNIFQKKKKQMHSHKLIITLLKIHKSGFVVCESHQVPSPYLNMWPGRTSFFQLMGSYICG